MESLQNQKNIFVILGMARSGTSAIARGMKALGVDLGEQLTPGNDKWNPKGFWEDRDIVYDINGKIFSALDFAPYGIRILDNAQQTSALLTNVRSSAIELLNKRFASTQYWGFKDPSTVKVLTFWQSIFDELQINDHYVIALRNPLAAAQSYKNLTGAELEIGLLLWLMHLLPAVKGTQGRKRIMVSYELLQNNPHMQLDRIKRNLKLTMHTETSEIDVYVNDFLDKTLSHYEFSAEDLKSHAAVSVTPLCIQAYQLFMKLAKDEIAFDSETFLSEWHVLQNELEKIYPVYCYVDILLKRNRKLERKIHSMHKSIVWKMLYPLRAIDDALRIRRRKKREKKRLVKAYG